MLCLVVHLWNFFVFLFFWSFLSLSSWVSIYRCLHVVGCRTQSRLKIAFFCIFIAAHTRFSLIMLCLDMWVSSFVEMFFAFCLIHKLSCDLIISPFWQTKWYLKAAEGGYVRAMYNISLCYSVGEGLPQNRKLARRWMKRAADHGHSKAQFEHGLTLFSVSISLIIPQ